MPRWCLVPKFFNIILSNLWPLKIKHYASNINKVSGVTHMPIFQWHTQHLCCPEENQADFKETVAQ